MYDIFSGDYGVALDFQYEDQLQCDTEQRSPQYAKSVMDCEVRPQYEFAAADPQAEDDDCRPQGLDDGPRPGEGTNPGFGRTLPVRALFTRG